MSAKASSKKEDFQFGKQLNELEKIVDALEAGELDLDAAVAQFERGAALADELQKYLAKAELKVKTIKTQLNSQPHENDN